MQLFEFERIRKILFQLKNYRIRYQVPVNDLQLKQENWAPYVQGTFFGEKNCYYTMKGTFELPEDWKEMSVALQVYSSLSEWDNTTNPQMKVFLNGNYIQAIDVNHREVRLDPSELTGTIALQIDIFSGREEKKFPLYVNLLAIDPIVEQVWFDFSTIFDSWRAIRKFGGEEQIYQSCLSQAANALDFRAPYTPRFYEGLTNAQECLQACYSQEIRQKVTAVGHTHIDLAWLWTAQQAVEKGERSFQTVLKLMDEYPEYTFLQSQPQLYQAIKEQYPELYQAIKEKIKSGRWEVEGAMWVEADCNLTSGESLVRQILYGKRFIKEEFDHESQILWLPDVFGYSAALPQILQKTNTPYFMTTKLSWNQFNQIPYDSFYWQGIDGSRVLTHFITTISEGYSPRPYYTTYNGLLDPYTVKGSFERYQQKDQHDEILIAYGYGDGGGGPTREMLETKQRLSKPLPQMPVITGDHAGKFFDRLAAAFAHSEAPVWFGELYFEYHRGTLTSIGKNKKANRKGEFLLQTIEKLYSAYRSEAYPQELLERLWKKLLFNQFHDILPGSSIGEVYQQTEEEYAVLFEEGEQLIQSLVAGGTASDANHQVVYNPLGFTRDAVIKVDIPAIQEDYLTQRTEDGCLLVKVPQVPSLGLRPLTLRETISEPVEQECVPLTRQLETTDFVVTFNAAYEMTALFDKRHQREVLPAGEVMNQLIAYEDLPMDYDAWDIDIYYDRKAYPVEDVTDASIVEQGEIRDTIRIKRTFEQSTIIQLIHFYHGTGRIDFETTVDWHQHHLLLKAQLPIAVNTLDATFDIQFGNVKRAIHKNTTWDLARFESCGQKWVDLSEDGYGVSVLTDCKYGFSTAYQKIGLSLIKSATDPYPEADQGLHSFTYSLYVHEGDWKKGQTMEEALALNVPAYVLADFDQQQEQSFLQVDHNNVLIDSVKKAEADEAIVVRLYEYHNRKTTCRLTAAKKIKRAVLTNLLEEEQQELVVTGVCHQVVIPFNPYEIQTVKVYFD